MYQPMSLAEVAESIRKEFLREDSDPWLWVRQFMDDFYHADAGTRQRLIDVRPEETGDARFDAYPAALAEHFALHYDLQIPEWVAEPGRFLDRWWFPTQFRSLHAMAIAESPASFRRRGIFIDKTEFRRC